MDKLKVEICNYKLQSLEVKMVVEGQVMQTGNRNSQNVTTDGHWTMIRRHIIHKYSQVQELQERNFGLKLRGQFLIMHEKDR